MKVNTFTKLFSLALICIIAFASCQKDSAEPKEPISLAGSWTATPKTEFPQEIYFSENGAFTMHFSYTGPNFFATTYNGTYKINGDKLIISIKEIINKELNKAETVTKVDQTLFEQATFSLKDNLLTVNYTTYPADGPVPTQLIFVKN